MKKIQLFLAVTSLIGFVHCGGANDRITLPTDPNPNVNAETTFQALTVVDNGAVVENPTITTITVDSDGTIAYFQQDQDATISPTEWNTQLSDEDFETLTTQITEANLHSQTDITLPEGEEPCTGSQDLDVAYFYLETDVFLDNAFTIDGETRCNADLIPDALNDVLDSVTALADEYAPATM